MNDDFIEIYPVTSKVSLFGIKNDTIQNLYNFYGFLISKNDKFCWKDTKKQLSNDELIHELSFLEKPFLPKENIIQTLRVLCGQKTKRKLKDDVEEEQEEIINDYDDDDDEDEEEEDEEENNAEDDDILPDEDVIDEDDENNTEEE